MFKTLVIKISDLTTNDFKEIEKHLASFAEALATLGNNYKAVSEFLNQEGFSKHNKINLILVELQQAMKLLREKIVSQRSRPKEGFSQLESKAVSLEHTIPEILAELPDDPFLLMKVERNSDYLNRFIGLYHNFYLIVDETALDDQEKKSIEQRNLLRNDIYSLLAAVVAKRDEIQKQQQKKDDAEFKVINHRYRKKRQQETLNEFKLQQFKKEFNAIVTTMNEKGDELELRARNCCQKNWSIRINQDASLAKKLARELQGQAGFLENPKRENLTQFKKNCSVILNEFSQSSLATRHHKWWKVVVANVALCLTGIGLLVSSARWLVTGNFLFFNQKDSAKKIEKTKEIIKKII